MLRGQPPLWGVGALIPTRTHLQRTTSAHRSPLPPPHAAAAAAAFPLAVADSSGTECTPHPATVRPPPVAGPIDGACSGQARVVLEGAGGEAEGGCARRL